MDKRKQKSRKIIIDAFFDLLKEKDIEKISMNEIAEKANVNRGTIYLNFIDKYDLLEKCIETKFVDLILLCEHGENELNQEVLMSIFDYLADHFDTLYILFKHADFSTFSACIFDEIAEILKGYFDSDVPVQFLASAITGVVTWWIKNSMPCSPAKVTEELWSLLKANLAETTFHKG